MNQAAVQAPFDTRNASRPQSRKAVRAGEREGRSAEVVDNGQALGLAEAFLNSIGLPCVRRPGASGFIVGVEIVHGSIHFDPLVAHVGDILHEAGHIACLSAPFRAVANGNIAGAQRALLEAASAADLHPDDPRMRAALQTGDAEATAWAWAAGKHLGLKEDLIIRDQDYSNDGASVRLGLSLNAHLGIHGLAHAGFCATSRYVAMHTGRPQFPILSKWLQDVGPDALAPVAAPAAPKAPRRAARP